MEKNIGWRPDNWDIAQIRGDNEYRCLTPEEWAEAGADAMLEALRGKGLHGEFTSIEWRGYVDGPDSQSFELPTRSRPKKGTLIIIPDEEVKDGK